MITLLRASYQDIERVAEYAGLSTDNKTDPSYFVELKNGDVFKEIDTGNVYKYNGATSQWVLQPATGGGGSGDTGVESFNGRTGAVVPVATDYPPSLIGAVNKAGDSMTGDLNMSGHTVTGISDALEDTDALPKGQADDIYVNVTGDTMTGALNMGEQQLLGVTNIVNGDTLTSNTAVALDKGYISFDIAGTRVLSLYGSAINAVNHRIQNVSNPQDNTDAANKQYVDTAVSGVQTNIDTVSGTVDDIIDGTESLPYLPDNGGTLSGPLNMGNNKITMGGTPTETTDVTNKGYVDGVVGVVSDEVDGILAGTTPITIPAATEAKIGGIKPGAGTAVSGDGTLTIIVPVPTAEDNGKILVAENGTYVLKTLAEIQG